MSLLVGSALLSPPRHLCQALLTAERTEAARTLHRVDGSFRWRQRSGVSCSSAELLRPRGGALSSHGTRTPGIRRGSLFYSKVTNLLIETTTVKRTPHLGATGRSVSPPFTITGASYRSLRTGLSIGKSFTQRRQRSQHVDIVSVIESNLVESKGRTRFGAQRVPVKPRSSRRQLPPLVEHGYTSPLTKPEETLRLELHRADRGRDQRGVHRDAGEIGEGAPGEGAEVAESLSGAVYAPRTPPPQFEAQYFHAERKISQRAGDGVAIVASVRRPIIESAAAFAALINTPPAKTHEVVNRPVSRNAINCVGAAYRADVSGEKNSHITTSEANRRQ
jgi:hypothetical protein